MMSKEITESFENYLKVIYFISKKNKGGWVTNSEISEVLKIKPSSVTGMLYKLRAKDLIHWKPRRSLRLTNKGKDIAEITVDIYNVLRDFFLKVLNIEDQLLLEQLCCAIEHHITPEVSDAFKHLIIEQN